MLVAMPTAMPAAPLTIMFGMAEGIRQARRWCRRIVLEVDGFLVDVLQHRLGDGGQPGLGITVGCGGIAIDRAVVTLAVDQRVTQVPALGHPHHGVIDGRVAVRVVLLDDFADHTCALRVLAVGSEAFLLHRVQDAALDRLQAVTNIRQRPVDDHGHRVIDETGFDLFGYLNRNDLSFVQKIPPGHSRTPAGLTCGPQRAGGTLRQSGAHFKACLPAPASVGPQGKASSLPHPPGKRHSPVSPVADGNCLTAPGLLHDNCSHDRALHSQDFRELGASKPLPGLAQSGAGCAARLGVLGEVEPVPMPG